MYKQILVPIDLADTDLAKPAIEAAVTLARSSGGHVRLVNVLPMTPVMLAEYVPPDFDVQQRKSAEEAMAIIARESGLDRRAYLRHGAARRHLSRGAGRGEGDQRRPHRDELAPAGHAHLFPRLQCRPRGALRQMLGAGGAQHKS